MTTATENNVQQHNTGRTIITVGLLLLWLLLILFGLISVWNPTWLQNLSRSGIVVEARNLKNYGDNFLKNGDFPLALAQYTRALEIKPDYLAVTVNLGLTYLHMGETEKAIHILGKALKEEKTAQGLIPYYLGEAFEQKGDMEKARRCYERALDSDFDQIALNRRLGTLYMESKDYEQARDAFEKALAGQTDPLSPYRRVWEYSLNLYETDTVNFPIIQEQLALTKTLTEADLPQYDFEIIRQIQISDPEIAKTHNHLGAVYIKLNDLPTAISHFEQSLQIWPDNPDAQRILPQLYRLQKDRTDNNTAS